MQASATLCLSSTVFMFDEHPDGRYTCCSILFQEATVIAEKHQELLSAWEALKENVGQVCCTTYMHSCTSSLMYCVRMCAYVLVGSRAELILRSNENS